MHIYKKYNYTSGFTFSSFSSACILSLFTLAIIFSLSITDIVDLLHQAKAQENITRNFFNVLNTSIYDSNQNRIAQTAKKIFFERSGGFAGISISTIVDIQSLPPDEAQRIQGMIDNAKEFFGKKKSSPPPKRAADYFKYKITVETEENQNTIETDDITMPSELRPLISYLTEKAEEVNK
jgi:hypothetical protein